MTEPRSEIRPEARAKSDGRGLIARSSISIRAPRARVWEALVNPELIRQYMFGTKVVSDWKPGASITWEGEWEGKRYKDKGEILVMEPGRRLRYSHFSPMTGLEDKSENYHTVTIDLADKDGQTLIALTQDNNTTEAEREHSETNWRGMLDGLRKVVED